MFKVGDKVVALEDTPYGITRNGWKGVVVETIDDNQDVDIWVEDLTGRYPVASRYFVLAGGSWKKKAKRNLPEWF